MTKDILDIMEQICGTPVYKEVCADENGLKVARPVYNIPGRYIRSRKHPRIHRILKKSKRRFPHRPVEKSPKKCNL